MGPRFSLEFVRREKKLYIVCFLLTTTAPTADRLTKFLTTFNPYCCHFVQLPGVLKRYEILVSKFCS